MRTRFSIKKKQEILLFSDNHTKKSLFTKYPIRPDYIKDWNKDREKIFEINAKDSINTYSFHKGKQFEKKKNF